MPETRNIWRYCAVCGKEIRIELTKITRGKNKGHWKTPEDGPWYWDILPDEYADKNDPYNEYWECYNCLHENEEYEFWANYEPLRHEYYKFCEKRGDFDEIRKILYGQA